MDTVTLTRGDQRVEVSRTGGLVVSYRVGGDELLAGRQSDVGPYAYRSSLLVPWPNRVTDGRWSWQGEDYELPVNEHTTGSAMHGLVDRAEFSLEEQDAESVSLVHHLAASAGYPFPLLVRAAYRLTDGGLVGRLEAVNEASVPAPVGLGVHSYLEGHGPIDGAVLRLPARTLWQADERWLETGRVGVADGGLDFREGRLLGGQVMDSAFTDLDRVGGHVEVGFSPAAGPAVTLWAGETCRWLVVYTADTLHESEARRSIAVEPQTCPPNALKTGDIDVVDPGASLVLDWGVRKDG